MDAILVLKPVIDNEIFEFLAKICKCHIPHSRGISLPNGKTEGQVRSSYK